MCQSSGSHLSYDDTGSFSDEGDWRQPTNQPQALDRKKGKDVMMQSLQAKFKQNQSHADTPNATRSHRLVKCNAFDRIWRKDPQLHDKLSDDCTTWKVANLLSSCLHKVRYELCLSNDKICNVLKFTYCTESKVIKLTPMNN